MKIFLLFISLSVFANEHCSSEKSLVDQDIALLGSSGCDEKKLKDPCSDCPLPLMRESFRNVKKASPDEVQEKLLKVAFDEYKKVAISNIVDIAKTRSLDNPKANFSKAKLACKVKTEADFIEGCSPKVVALIKKSDIFNGFNKQMANEIASIVSKKPISLKPTLLTRNSNSCFIPEQTLLQVSATVLAETFDPIFISILQKIPKGKYSSINLMLESEEFYEQYGEGVLNLSRYMKSNPLLTDSISSPDKMLEFFESVPQPITPANIKDYLYNEDNNEKLDTKFAEKCADSFSALKEFVCSETFAKGDVDFELENNYQHLFNEGFVPLENPADRYYDQKIQAKKFCKEKNDKEALSLTKINLKISERLDSPRDSETSLEQYQDSTYKKDFSSMAELLCKDEPCTDMKNISCRFMDNYKKTLKTDSKESKLANSSNDEVNSLLRSMIGVPEKLDKKTRDVLVAEGILPDSSGDVASTGNIPERQVGNSAPPVPASSPIANSSTSSSHRPVQQSQTTYKASSFDTSNENTNRSPTYVTSPKLPNNSVPSSGSQDLERFQSEIARRISADDTSKPNTHPNKQKVVSDSTNILPGRTPYLKPISGVGTVTSPLPAGDIVRNMNNHDPNESKQAAEIQDEKYKKSLSNAAIENMAGVQAIKARNGEIKVEQKLSKISLTIPEEAKVNLSDVFEKEYNQNDKETQDLQNFLKSKSDFLLQINSFDFKVVFDKEGNFKILSKKGSSRQTSGLIPQIKQLLDEISKKSTV